MYQDSSYNAKENQKLIDEYDYLGKAASARDCTGLIPWLPTSAAQRESYEDVYSYQTPAIHMKPKTDSGQSSDLP